MYQLGRNHDTIIVYGRSPKSKFFPLYKPYTEEYKKGTKLCSIHNKKYTTSAAHNSEPEVNPRPNLTYEWNGHTRQWYVSKEKMESSYYNRVKDLSKKMKISYSIKTRSGFFFSGEEFITYINNLKEMKDSLEADLEEMEIEFKDKSEYVRNLALGPIRSQLYELESKYDGELRFKSHGEGFLTFFKNRMHQKGIYLLDEPETPLSATNQYQLLVLITDLVQNGSQVIIATHSPILMALKDAVIYNFTEKSIERIEYENIESVVFTKHFLNNKNNFIDRL